MAKKALLAALIPGIMAFALAACQNTSSSQSSSSSSDPGEEDIRFIATLLEAQGPMTLDSGASKTFVVNKDIRDNNYIQILLKTDRKIVGKFKYHDNDDPNKVVTEDFYIEPDENLEVIDFRQFLDAYRPVNSKTGKEVSVGAFEKTLETIEFKNVEDGMAHFGLMGVNLSDREIPDYDKEIYIEGDSLKAGMDLLTGGTLTYLEKTDYDGDPIEEVIDEKNNIKIGVAYSERPDTKMELSSHVNLINIYDAGRQIQQSYYASIGGYGSSEEERKDRTNDDGGTQNGYTRNISVTADKNGYYWPYNPVQGGDEMVNFSQIIDYRVTKTQLYCKVRALDWAGYKSGGYGNPDDNRVTKSYMENWFEIKDGMLYATNRFVDWNGFYDMEGIQAVNIEMPATYISQPLHVFQSYNGDDPYAEELDTSYGALERNDNLGPWKYGGHRTNKHTEDWFAWTNDEDFGVGVYIPGATYYSSGRSCVGIKTTDRNPDGNLLNVGAYDSPMAGEYRYNKPEAESDYTSCYLRNTSYTAPVKAVKMKEYIPLSYTYVVAVDYVPVFREMFKEVDAKGEVKSFNEIGLNSWN